jgi:hypothetical protein
MALALDARTSGKGLMIWDSLAAENLISSPVTLILPPATMKFWGDSALADPLSGFFQQLFLQK